MVILVISEIENALVSSKGAVVNRQARAAG
jgi:hypothetical protein